MIIATVIFGLWHVINGNKKKKEAESADKKSVDSDSAIPPPPTIDEPKVVIEVANAPLPQKETGSAFTAADGGDKKSKAEPKVEEVQVVELSPAEIIDRENAEAALKWFDENKFDVKKIVENNPPISEILELAKRNKWTGEKAGGTPIIPKPITAAEWTPQAALQAYHQQLQAQAQA